MALVTGVAERAAVDIVTLVAFAALATRIVESRGEVACLAGQLLV